MGSLLSTKNEQLWKVTLRTVKNYCIPNLHKGWWEMCAEVSTHSLGTCHWEWGHRSRVIRTVKWRKCCLCRTVTLLRDLRHFIWTHKLFPLSCYLVDTNQVQSIQSRVSMNTVNNGTETLSKRQLSFLWGSVSLTTEVPEMLCWPVITCGGDDGPAEGYCGTS